MKKIVVLLALVAMTTNCKKKETSPSDPNDPNSPTATEAFCIYQNVSGVNKVIDCAASQQEALDKVKAYRDKGISTTTAKKSSCSDC